MKFKVLILRLYLIKLKLFDFNMEQIQEEHQKQETRSNVTSETKQHFELEYPNSISLSMKYYDNDNFNNIRRCKLILFSDCLGPNEKFNKNHLYNEINNKKSLVTTSYLISEGLSALTIECVNKYLYPFYLTKDYIIRHLERGCLNRAIEKAKTYNIRCVWSNDKFVSLYHTICYKVASNLDPTSSIKSDYIFKKILNNEVDLLNMANMSSKSLCPKKYEQLDEKISKRTNLERKVKYSELYRCSKCKRNQTTTERRYSRSMDEGTELTIICTFCSHQWHDN